VGLFSGFSRALSSIGSAASQLVSGVQGAIGDVGTAIGKQAGRFGGQVSKGAQQVGQAALAVAPLAQFIPGPIGFGAAAVTQIGDFFGSQGQPISVAGFAATQQRGAFGPQTRAAFSQPAPVLPQRSQFGFGGRGFGFGGGGFSAPFAARQFQGFGFGSARSPQAFGGAPTFQPAAARGASPFGFGGFRPPVQQFGFGRPSFAGFSFLG